MNELMEAPEQKNKTAGEALKALVNKRLQVTGGTPIGEVSISSVGLRNGQDVLQVTLPGSMTNKPKVLSDIALEEMGKVPDLTNHVQFESPEKHATLLKEKVENLKTMGAPIPDSYMEWRGFKGELAKSYRAVKKHGLEIRSFSGTTAVSFDIQLTAEEAKDSKGAINKIEGNIKGREAAIKTALAEEHINLKNITDEAKKAEIREQYKQLQFKYSDFQWNAVDDKGGNVNVDITLLSPDQVKTGDPDVQKKMLSLSEDDRRKEDDRLKATNITTELTTEQLGKALGGSFLHAGEKADDIFHMVAGGVDMELRLKKLLKGIKEKSSPEVQKSIDDLLNDDTFKGLSGKHYALDDEDKAGKSTPIVSKEPGKPLTIELLLPAGTADGIIDKLASLATPAQAAGNPWMERTERVESPQAGRSIV